MIIRINILFVILQMMKLCRVTDDYVFPTISESYDLCGAVILGEVEDTLTTSHSYIYLKNSEYYKGCGPTRVKIEGYSAGSRCGVFPPRPGKKIIVFVCLSDGKETWRLHNFSPFAG